MSFPPAVVVVSSAPLPSNKAYAMALSELLAALRGSLGIAAQLWAPEVVREDATEPAVNVSLGGIMWRVGRRFQLGSLPRIGNALCRVSVAWGAARNMAAYPSPIVWTRDALVAAMVRNQGSSVVLEVHHLPTAAASLEIRAAAKRLRRRLIIVAISEPIRQAVAGLVPPDTSLLLEPSGVNSDFLEIRPSISRESTTITFMGRADSYGVDKGIGDLFALAERLQEVEDLLGPPVRIRIVGGTEIEAAALAERATSRGISPATLSCESHQSRAHVLDIIDQSDLMCATYPDDPRFRGSSPLKLIEYAGAGRPIVATDVPAVRNVLHPGSYFPYRPGDIDSMIWAIKRALDPTQARAAVSAARRVAESRSWPDRTSRILSRLVKSTD